MIAPTVPSTFSKSASALAHFGDDADHLLPGGSDRWTYEAIGDEREAIAHYRKALKIDPSLEAARDNLQLLGATHERKPFHRQTKRKH